MKFKYLIEYQYFPREDVLGAINPTTAGPYTLTDSRHPKVLSGRPAEPGLQPRIVNDDYCKYPTSDPRMKIKEKPFGSRRE